MDHEPLVRNKLYLYYSKLICKSVLPCLSIHPPFPDRRPALPPPPLLPYHREGEWHTQLDQSTLWCLTCEHAESDMDIWLYMVLILHGMNGTSLSWSICIYIIYIYIHIYICYRSLYRYDIVCILQIFTYKINANIMHIIHLYTNHEHHISPWWYDVIWYHDLFSMSCTNVNSIHVLPKNQAMMIWWYMMHVLHNV